MNLQLQWPIPAALGGITLLTMGDAAAFMSAFNPSIFTIRTFRSDSQQAGSTAQDIYIGIALAGGMSALVAIGAAMAAESWWPIVGTIAAEVVILAAYSWALAHPHSNAKPMNKQSSAGGWG